MDISVQWPVAPLVRARGAVSFFAPATPSPLKEVMGANVGYRLWCVGLGNHVKHALSWYGMLCVRRQSSVVCSCQAAWVSDARY